MLSRLAVLAAIPLSACASAPTGKTAGSADWPHAVIDAHVRATFTGASVEAGEVTDSKAGLAAEMSRFNVVGAVSIEDPGAPYADLSDLNVVRCLGLPKNVDAATLEAELASGRYACVTVFLGYQEPDASDPGYEPAYRLAEKYKVPVVLQTGRTEYPVCSPFGADKAARSHPRITFVLTHEGNPHPAERRDRDEFLRRQARPAVVFGLGDDPWIRPAADVAYQNKNVVLDASALLVGDLLAAAPDRVANYLLERARWIYDNVADPSKLMFGTGWPRTAIGPYLEVFKQAIPREHWQAVFHDNAARVYGFDKRPLPKAQRIANVQALNDPR